MHKVILFVIVNFCFSTQSFAAGALPTCNGRWTRFYDRDNPSGHGDFEILRDLRNEQPGEICNNPTALDARLAGTHTHYTQTGQILSVSLSIGLSCRNVHQRNRRCLDYEIRFCCPIVVPLPTCNGQWTRFYDRDNPGDNGDFETLLDLRNEQPGEICNNPTALDARLVGTHTHYTQTGQILSVSLSIGLRCRNIHQRNRRCLDYEIRFCCP